ncbi:transposase [Streptosporangium sp. NPDC000095]|uniref:IS701 family transposase n=1 Tax=Streptosporangium sp. NPDC000095 TaxID=3366184 RepID=UPI0036A9D31A
MRRNSEDLTAALAPMFARVEPRLQAVKYIRAVMSDLPKRNGWTIAEWAGDHSPDATQRLLNRASWDTAGAMSIVRRFAVARLDAAAPPAALKVGALDETGQEKKGTATAGVKRQHMGCAGGVDNGINTVHLAYIRAGTGHALIAAKQGIPAEQISDPITAITTGLPLNLTFATKGELAIDLLRDAYTDGVHLDFVTGDEVYGACTKLRAFLEEHDQAYVLRVRAAFTLTLGGGTCLTCDQVVAKHLKQKRKWTLRSAGAGSKGARTYAWAWIATAGPPFAGPQTSPHRGPGLSLLLRPRQPARNPAPPDRRSRAALARGGKFRVRQGPVRP